MKDPTKTHYGSVQVEPTAFSGQFEHGSGAAFDSSQVTKYLDAVGHCASGIFGEFKIVNFTRAGARFFVMAGETESALDPSAAMAALFSAAKGGKPSSFIRDTKDFGISLEGVMESAVSYRISTGPGSPADFEKFLTQKVTATPPVMPKRHELSADVDLYETNTHIPSSRILRWITTKFNIIEELLPDLRLLVLRR